MRFHFSHSQSQFTIEGSAESYPGRELAQALACKIMEQGSIKLPEPNAKVDVNSGKTIPFQPGEKESLIKDQQNIEAEIIEEITGTSSPLSQE